MGLLLVQQKWKFFCRVFKIRHLFEINSPFMMASAIHRVLVYVDNNDRTPKPVNFSEVHTPNYRPVCHQSRPYTMYPVTL